MHDLSDTEEDDVEVPFDSTRYEEIKASNHKRFQDLTNRGFVLPPPVVSNLQMEALLDLLGSEARQAWAMLFELRVEHLLDEAEAGEARAKLTAGVPPAQPSGLVLPGTH